MRLFGTIDGEVSRRDRSAALTPPFDFFAGGYLYYVGPDVPAAIDYDTPVGYSPPGVTAPQLAGVIPFEDRDYYLACRAVSDAGVEETNTSIVIRVRIEAGELVGPPPAALDADLWRIEPAADGYVRLSGTYLGRDAEADATGIQVARVWTSTGAVDWGADLIETVTLAGRSAAGTYAVSQLLTPQYSHGETVRVAVRAVTAEGVAGAHAVLGPIATDTVAPPAVDYVSAGAAT